MSFNCDLFFKCVCLLFNSEAAVLFHGYEPRFVPLLWLIAWSSWHCELNDNKTPSKSHGAVVLLMSRAVSSLPTLLGWVIAAEFKCTHL